MMEVVGEGSDAVFTPDHRLENGTDLALGDRPDLWTTFDEERLTALTVDRPSAATLGSLTGDRSIPASAASRCLRPRGHGRPP